MRVSRFDRYILSQLLILFSFFALVLVSIYWVNRAVRLFDELIADGQSAFVFLEFTALGLPNVIRRVLPMSVFAAAVYVTNRLSSESELTVMQATGFSPWRLARPVAYFGLVAGAMMAVMTHFLVPVSLTQLGEREHEISQNATSGLLTEGTFLHPTRGMTFYIRKITPEGELRDVFLSDRRQPDQVITYTASKAYLVGTDTGPKLVMVDGLSQYHDTLEDSLFTTHFEDFTYDIAALMSSSGSHSENLREISTRRLMFEPEAVAEITGDGLPFVLEELHDRFNQPLLIMVSALIGFSTLLVGGYSRFGVWKQIIVAFVLLVFVESVKNAGTDLARSDPALWPAVYLPSLTGAAIVLMLLWLAANPIRWRRKAAS